MDLFDARTYLKIDIANSAGFDKLTWQERIDWFDQNQANLLPLMAQAEDPALYFAGITAWSDVLQGSPIGYTISLDATSSGLQLLAVLTGDRKAAEICNVVDTGKRRDAYTEVYKHMLGKTGDTSKIKREDTKAAIMTALYGSTAMPKRVFGEGELLAHFEDSMGELTPGCWELNKAFLALWDPTATAYSWVLPDNFHVHVKVMDSVVETVHFLNEPFDVISKVNAPVEQGRSLGANTIHSLDGMIVREMTRRCNYNPKRVEALFGWLNTGHAGTRFECPDDEMVQILWGHYQKSGYLSARILDHLLPENLGHVDPATILELLETLPEKPFKVLSIHD